MTMNKFTLITGFYPTSQIGGTAVVGNYLGKFGPSSNAFRVL